MTALPFWLDALLAALLLTGAFFALVGSWGLAKLSDFLKRLHGPTKATTLGVGCVLIASSIWFSVDGGRPSVHEFLITLFLFLTAPVSAYTLGRAALALRPQDRPARPGEQSLPMPHADSRPACSARPPQASA